MNMYRKIIHVDMDQFYAAVEQRDRPELRGKPVVVGMDAPRGVVATASYEARPFGVHSAIAIQTAKRLCPDLVIVPPDFQKYKAVSAQIRGIFREYTDLVEPVSLDEAFLDVTENKPGIALGMDVAREIKRRILDCTGLTSSAGVSYCKFLAKIASDYRKPDGLCVIHPDRALDFIAELNIEKFWGIGEKTAEKMHRMGVFNGADLRETPVEQLVAAFGKVGRVFHDFANGKDERPVISEWERKSVSCEKTFETDIIQPSDVTIALYHIVLELLGRIERTDFEGYTLTLKVKFHDFRQITRSITVDYILRAKEEILPLAKRLMKEVDYSDHPIRLIGLGVGNHREESDVDRQRRLQLELDFEEKLPAGHFGWPNNT
ncbi:MAG: DNA polymerase IV [Bacteroidales bacterium]|nr:DNA polymerase IV [Bacteroidales bacterium]